MLYRCGPTLCLVLLLPAGLTAQPVDDRYTLRFGTLNPHTSVVTVYSFLDMENGSLGAPEQLAGFTYSVCLDSAVQVHQGSYGADIADMNGGFSPGFWVFSQQSGGFVVGVIIDITGNFLIPPGTDYEIGWFDCSAPTASDIDPHYCNSVGSPPVETLVVRDGGASSIPIQEQGLGLIIPPPPTFGLLRGDCNASGQVAVNDVIRILLKVFPVPNTFANASCDNACDANDDGVLSILDAIAVVNYLFGAPSIPLPEPNTCGGLDPTPQDALDCDDLSQCP